MVRSLCRLPKKKKAAFLTELSRSAGSAEMHMPLFFFFTELCVSVVLTYHWRSESFESPWLFPPHPRTHISFSFCLEPLCWSDHVFIFKDLIFSKYLNLFVLHSYTMWSSNTKSYLSKCDEYFKTIKPMLVLWDLCCYCATSKSSVPHI